MSDEPQKLSKADKDELLKTARARYSRAMDNERENITLAYDDLEFLAGRQWPDEVVRAWESEGRPVLTFNQMPQFVHQVTGDIRKMAPAIKFAGVDDQADPKMADMREGMTRYIENRSDAKGIYYQAADSQVACGIGHVRVGTEYASDSTFEQEIRIEGVDDGVSVLWDPDAKRITRDDALWCFVPVDYTLDTFKEKWPNATVDEFEDLKTWKYYSDWYEGDKVRVAEYWTKKPKMLTLALTPDGQTIDCTEDDPDYSAQEKLRLCVANGAKIEKRESFEVCRYLITCSDILEGPEEWAGKFIPIVPFIGEEVKIGRKTVRRGIIREAKDAQRQFNYFCAAHTEVVALQPKAPFMVTEINVAKYQEMWESANTKNFPYLLYTPDAKNGNLLPSRVAPAVSSQGITDGLTLANENMRRITGLYDASLGARSNETSGVAIKRREEQGDTGTIVYRDNFTRGVRQVGKIVGDLLRHVYDTERTVRIMGEDGKIDIMKINQERDEAGMPIVDPQTGQPVMLNDITLGSYDVIAEAGTSYATKREEASDSMLAFAQALPETAMLISDYIATAQDWPMHDKIAERLRSALPPQILAAEKAKEAEENGQPPQVDPAQAQQQQMQEQVQAAQLQAGMEELQNKTAEDQAKVRKANADADKAEADAETARINTQIAQQKLSGGTVDILKGAEQHDTDIAHQHERHDFEMGQQADNHFTSQEQGQEKHEATIQRMQQPKEAAPA